MVRILLVVAVLTSTAAAESPKQRGERILKAQVAALAADDDKAMIATFATDATLGGYQSDEPVADQHGFLQFALGGSPHTQLKKHAIGPIAAGGNDQVVWYSAEVTLTSSNYRMEERSINKKTVLRITGLATAASGWKVVAAMMDRPVPFKHLPDATGVAQISGATQEGKLSELVSSPKDLLGALSPDAVVIGTEAKERGVGAGAKKLVKGWAKLRFDVAGPPREVTTKDYAYTLAAVDWIKGDRKVRFRVMAFALPADGGWKVVAAHYSGDQQ